MSARAKFSVMMFLEFFIMGAWLLLTPDYLDKLGMETFERSLILNAFAVASLTAMFFSTQFADRNFAAEKFLAFSHLIGGLAILPLFWVTDFWPFFILLLIHALFYVPTISITNAIALANLTNAQDEFGKVRLWGTIGWIAASLPFTFILADWARIPALGDVPFTDWLGVALTTSKSGAAYMASVPAIYLAAGIASLVLAAFSLTLPHTPPKPAVSSADKLAWLKAMRQLNRPFLIVLLIATFIDAAVHQGFFLLTPTYLIDFVGVPAQWIMPVMSIGQVAEIVTMAILGLVLKRLGWRYTMVLGVLGHTARFLVFAYYPEPWAAISINVLHGVCYAFFFATVYIFVDEFFPKDTRSSAQGLFNFVIWGFGPFVANFVWPQLKELFTTGSGRTARIDYETLFLMPALSALAAALLLLLFFHPPERAAEEPAVTEAST